MLQVIKGIYQNGHIALDEKPNANSDVKVLVTFLDETSTDKIKTDESGRNNVIIIGSLKGKINVPDDFDEPLDDLKDYMN